MAYYFRLDHQARLLAVFSPKCGSTTLKAWLHALDQHGNLHNGQKPNQQFFVNRRKALAYPDYFKVLFLRDPLRRLVSFYAHWVVRYPCEWSHADQQRCFWLHNRSFREFMYILEYLQLNGLKFQHHLEAQLARTEMIDFDRVILVEQLRPGLLALNQQLGFEFAPPHNLRTQYAPDDGQEATNHLPDWFRKHGIPAACRFYDPELMELAEKMYAEDLAFYRRHGEVLTLQGSSD
jgi:Sulfotransferase family